MTDVARRKPCGPRSYQNVTQHTCGPTLWYYIFVFKRTDLTFTRSSQRHGITPEDAYYAMTHPHLGVDELDGEAGDMTVAFYGHPHAQTTRVIEVFAARKPWGDIVVFHAMDRPDLVS